MEGDALFWGTLSAVKTSGVKARGIGRGLCADAPAQGPLTFTVLGLGWASELNLHMKSQALGEQLLQGLPLTQACPQYPMYLHQPSRVGEECSFLPGFRV